MVKYRPHRGMLDDAMSEAKTFDSLAEMYEYIANNSSGLFGIEDLSVTSDLGKDPRIDWKETRYVCIRKYGSEIFDFPQCIGMCSIEE